MTKRELEARVELLTDLLDDLLVIVASCVGRDTERITSDETQLREMQKRLNENR